jgi:hypothetical protein
MLDMSKYMRENMDRELKEYVIGPREVMLIISCEKSPLKGYMLWKPNFQKETQEA